MGRSAASFVQEVVMDAVPIVRMAIAIMLKFFSMLFILFTIKNFTYQFINCVAYFVPCDVLKFQLPMQQFGSPHNKVGRCTLLSVTLLRLGIANMFSLLSLDAMFIKRVERLLYALGAEWQGRVSCELQ